MKKKMNPQTKRAVMVLSIIALLILIAGIGSCSMQLRQSDDRPAVTDEPNHPSAVSDDETVTLPKDRESSNESDTPSDSSDADEKSEDGKSTEIRDSQDNNNTSNPTKPSITPKPVTPTPKPADPSVPVKPAQPTPTPTVPVKPTEPTKPVKPTEPVKPTNPDNSDDDDDSGSGSGGSGGGHVSYPAAVVEIITPEYSHAGTEFEVKTSLRNVKSLEWTVTQDGGDAKESDFLKGTLDKNGGKITITMPGSYIFTAAAKNYGGSTYTFTKTVIIYPVFEITVSAGPYAHTDQAFTVSTTLSDNVKQQLNWHIYKDGNEVSWEDTVIGTLSNTGGSIQLKDKGKYTLKAMAFDETSREFFSKADIEVLPVVELSLQVPKTAHTDTPTVITAETKELGELSVNWSVTKGGQETALSDCAEGTLDNVGGSVRFREKGVYALTAAVTDKSGRVFTATEEIKVYPVAAFSFTLPETAHTDKAVTVSVTSSELQDMKAEWMILHNGESVPLADVLEGTLTNEGGSVRFTKKGGYTLKVKLMDETGRTYTHEDSIVVYPVAETGFYLPEKTHTDTAVEVKTSFKEADGLNAVWSLKKGGKEIPLSDGFDGTLDNNGGKIRFQTVGSYELTATVTDGTGRSFTYTAPVTVYPVITVSMELRKETHTDRVGTASVTLTNAGTLPVAWSISKNNIPVTAENTLDHEGGTISLTEKGYYAVTASVTDEAGRTFSDSKNINVYPVPNIAFDLAEAVHTDDVLSVNTVLTDMEDLTAVWYVDNTYGFQDWDTYVDGKLTNNGGSIRFKRAGVYDLQARVTDPTGRVFLFNSGKVEVLPVLSLSFELPANGYTDTQIDLRTRGNNNVLPVEWTLMKNGEIIPLDQAVSGTLNAQGGKIRFPEVGEYRLTVSMTDALGRVFSYSGKISIYPLYNCNFSMPSTIHTGQSFAVNMGSDVKLNGKSIAWSLTKDGNSAAVSEFFKGSLGNNGSTVHVDVSGSYTLTATITDELDRAFTAAQTITVTNTAPTKPTLTANVTRTYLNGKFLVNLTAASTDPDGDMVFYEFDGKAADNYYALGTHTVKVRAKDSYGGVSDWTAATFAVSNAAPSKPMINASITRNVKSGKFLVNLSVSSTDPDGDSVSYEYQNKAADNYYSAGTHTVQVRAKDNYGGMSEWAQTTFTISNSAPTTPVITRTPNGNSVAPGTAVTIRAASTDPDGDAITYVWEGRNAETQTYPLGKNIVRVKAIDSTGAESPWTAIIFFVADPNRGGGMTLTGPESTIIEDGVDGATITSWTFTVPQVSGHSASYDYGQVRGYNRLTGKWEQLPTVSFDSSIGSSFAATDGNPARVYSHNGVYMYGTLQAGIYTKLEFYYFTPHSCMYNKSNITYSVEFFFE
ncbi:S-layer homology domain-containing protein [Anaerocolumna sp. AGMB13025]|uniref:S-layer homology domain-containing protein n=1 Tax=Anaerocolumna sp. AGMB13025 TaxID=3039116 RepID=UPI00241E8B14|nr:S-layer homology domain-containing protein [Anaerocolumna sp. AGMB13025]WFR59142.1 S-layer homology domain-containing protein [Anaerocolumna sp. AGMB13025]